MIVEAIADLDMTAEMVTGVDTMTVTVDAEMSTILVDKTVPCLSKYVCTRFFSSSSATIEGKV